MADDLTLKIKIANKSITDLKKGIADAFDFKKNAKDFFGGISSGVFGGAGGKGAGGGAGAAGFLGKIAGASALTLGVLEIISSSITKMLNVLTDASPALKGTFIIFGNAMKLFFKPFGDFLSVLLRPAMRALLKMAILFNKTFGGGKSPGESVGEAIFSEEDIAKVKGAFPELAEDMEIAKKFFGDVVNGLGNPADIVGLIFRTIETLIDIVFGEGTTKRFIDGITGFVQELPGKLLDGLVGINDALAEGFSGIVDFAVTEIPSFLGDLAKGLGDLVDAGAELLDDIVSEVGKGIGVLSGFGQQVLDDMVEGLGDLAGDIAKGVIEFATEITDALSGLARGIGNIIIEGLNSLIEALRNIRIGLPGGGEVFPFGGLTNIPSLADGGIVNKPTLALIGESGPEAVVPLNGANGAGGVNITISGGVFADEASMDSLIDRIQEAVQGRRRSRMTFF